MPWSPDVDIWQGKVRLQDVMAESGCGILSGPRIMFMV